jgi:poly(A) polymerase
MQIIEKSLKISSNGHKRILTTLKKNGGQARLIGGCVRDALLNKDSYDIDIATTLRPEEVIDILSRAKVEVIPTGITFGTVTAILKDEKFEITTLRKDISCMGRYAIVAFSSDFAEDAQRRDFTINALSYCPFENKIYDYFNGLTDLKHQRVVFIGQAAERIKEDYLRILRFFRFSCHYAANINEEGLKACSSLQEGLKILSRERIKSEMDKIIVAQNAYLALDQMFASGILTLLFSVQDYDKSIFYDASFFDSQLCMRYALLLYRIKDLQINTLMKWKFSKQEATKILLIINFINLPTITKFIMKKIWFEKPDYKEYLFAAAIIGKLDSCEVENFIRQYDKLIRHKLPVTGHDLLRINIKNTEIGTRLEYLKRIWLESDFTKTKSQLLTFVKDYEN